MKQCLITSIKYSRCYKYTAFPVSKYDEFKFPSFLPKIEPQLELFVALEVSQPLRNILYIVSTTITEGWGNMEGDKTLLIGEAEGLSISLHSGHTGRNGQRAGYKGRGAARGE